jgi:hypothetical protein
MSVLATLFAGLALAAPAHAGFVPALGSPFATDVPGAPIVVGDADRNGTVDVAAGRLQLLRGDGSGHLRPPSRIAMLPGVDALAAGDLTGEGQIDYVAVVDGVPDSVVMYSAALGAPYGAMGIDPDVGESGGIALGDLDGDRLMDVVVTHAGTSDEVSVLLNRGASFMRDDYSAGVDLSGSVELVDLTGDGWLDVLAGSDDPEVSLLANQQDGTLDLGVVTTSGAAAAASSVEIADFDGDARPDVATTAGQAGVALLRGIGGGALAPFGPPRATGVGAATDLAVGDLNGDARTDLAASSEDGEVAVLLGNGSGALAPAPGSPVSSGAIAADQVEVADMNRDGQFDVVTGNGPSAVSVLLNTDTGFLQPLPAGIDFGPMPAGSQSLTRTVTMRATRGRIRITRLDFRGSRAFSVAAGRCVGRTLTLGQQCTLTVTFTPPRRAGRAEALISLDANAPAIVVPLGATPRAPQVSELRLRPRVVRPGRRMVLRYLLSEGARVRTLVQQALPGRRVAGQCVVLRPSNEQRRRCTIWRTLTKLARQRDAGANRQRLRARSRGRVLAPGRYRLSVSAADAFRNRSPERTVRFRVKR